MPLTLVNAIFACGVQFARSMDTHLYAMRVASGCVARSSPKTKHDTALFVNLHENVVDKICSCPKASEAYYFVYKGWW